MTPSTAALIRTSLLSFASVLAALFTARYFFPVEERTTMTYYAVFFIALIAYFLAFHWIVNRRRKPEA